MNPYGEVVLEHARNPRNYGSLEVADVRHEAWNPVCGDRLRMELAVGPGETVTAVRFQGDLCMIAKAAGSLLTEIVSGSNLQAIENFSESHLIAALQTEIRPGRVKCALLPLNALQSAVREYRNSGQLD